MLKGSGLTVTRGGQNLIVDLAIDINPGDLVVIVGPNGAGKSTLLKCLMGWLKPNSGRVTVQKSGKTDGISRAIPLAKLSSLDRAAKIAWLPQRPHLSESLPVIEVVSSARFRFGESVAIKRQKAMAVLDKFGISSLADKNWNRLSGGECQRAAIASLVAQESEIWLLDEPANHLDPAIQQRVYNDIIGAWRDGQTIVLVTHDINLMLRSVPSDMHGGITVLGLKNGCNDFSCGLGDTVLASRLSKLYDIPVQEIDISGKTQLVFGAFG